MVMKKGKSSVAGLRGRAAGGGGSDNFLRRVVQGAGFVGVAACVSAYADELGVVAANAVKLCSTRSMNTRYESCN